jgi:hypothetical protein
VKGAKRVMTFALPVAVAAAALLCFAGGAYARSTADQALAVSVDGPGTITGNGIACAATARMTVGGQLESSGSFTFRRGAVTVDLPARRAGLHQVVLTARNAAGRTFTVRWNILLR